jgi:mRNA interferase MazF
MRKRGEIWLADLNPRRGTEPGKTRHVIIVQAQALLDAEHPSTLVVPLTTQLIDAAEPLRIRIRASGSLKKDSDALIDQVRAIDNRRLVQGPLSCLPRKQLDAVGHALFEVLEMTGDSARPRNHWWRDVQCRADRAGAPDEFRLSTTLRVLRVPSCSAFTYTR